MNNTKSIKFNFIMNFILTASSFIFPLITFPYVSRVLLPEGVGRVDFANSVVSYFIMIAMLGVPTYGIRACAQVRDDKEKLSKTVQELMIINLVLAVICYALLGISLCCVERFRQEKDVILIVSAGILLNAIGVNWFYSAIEEYSYITVRSLIFKVASVIIMFLFIKDQSDYPIYAVMTLVAASGSYVLNFIRLRRFITFKRFQHYEFRRHIRSAMIFFAMTVATTIYTNLDTVMLGFMTGHNEVGYYGAAIRVKQILVSLVTSLGAVLLPRLSYYIQIGKKEEFGKVVAKALRFVIFLSVPLIIFFTLYAWDVILILSGEEYASAVLPMQIIMPTVILIGVTNILGIQIMVPIGREKQVVVSVAAGGLVDLILNAIFIPKMGAAGAAIGTLAAEGVVLVVQAYFLKDMIRKLPKVSIWRTGTAAVLATSAVLAAQSVVCIPALLIQLGARACIFGGVYLGVALILKEPVLYQDILPAIKRRG